MGHDGVRAVHVPQKVGFDDAPVRCDRRVLEASDSADADVVDPHVHMSELGDGGPRERRDSGWVGHVSGHGQGACAGLLAFVGRRKQRLAVARTSEAPRAAKAVAPPMPLEAPVRTTTWRSARAIGAAAAAEFPEAGVPAADKWGDMVQLLDPE